MYPVEGAGSCCSGGGVVVLVVGWRRIGGGRALVRRGRGGGGSEVEFSQGWFLMRCEGGGLFGGMGDRGEDGAGQRTLRRERVASIDDELWDVSDAGCG